MATQHIGRTGDFRALSHERPSTKPPQGYARLMQVKIQHDYYNADGNACPDFSVLPTEATVDMMTSVGLLLRPEPDGFSVLYDLARADGLLNCLKRQGEVIGPKDYYPLWGGENQWRGRHDGGRISDLKGHLKTAVCAALAEKDDDGTLTALLKQPAKTLDATQYWTRLRFILVNGNPFFINISNLPLATNPGRKNFFFNNMQAHSAPEGTVYLNTGSAVSGRELVSTRPTCFAWEVPEGDGVLVRDLSGRVVLDLPAKVPKSLSGLDPGRITGQTVRDVADADSLTAEDSVQWHMVQVKLIGLPEDRYVLETTNSNMPTKTILYTTGKPLPMAFIDLLFSNPIGNGPGIYPVDVTKTVAQGAITPVQYCLRFKARRTYWSYFIVPKQGLDEFSDLKIETVAGRPVTFDGPDRVVLPNGQPAYAFVSQEAIALRQQSGMRFRLLGRRRSRPEDLTVLVACLPVASIQQVRAPIQGVSPDHTAFSDIYVYV